MRYFLYLFFLWFTVLDQVHGGVEVGQYNDPRDLTLKIHDPFAQENADLMQPVVGQYDIKILPPYVRDLDASPEYKCEGLFFKQIGKLIYIDIRQPPIQQKSGAYDLSVTLKITGEPDSANRLKRHIIYTDSATDVLLVIDNSRSMKKNDPAGLRYEACENFIHLASLSNRIQRIGVIKFSGTAKIILPWSEPSLAKKRQVSRLLSSSKPGNFTNINEAFELSAKMFEDSVATEKVVVLLTDGKNEPDIYRDTHKLLKEQGVRIFTVGLSEETDASQLSSVSQETGGEFFKAVDDERLLRIYNKIAQQLSEFKPMLEGSAVREIRFPLTSYDEFVDINVYNFDKTKKVQLIDSAGKEVPYHSIMGKEQDSTRLLRISKPKLGWYRLRLENGEGSFSYEINTHSKLFMKLFPLEKKYLKGEIAHFAVSLAHRQEAMLDSVVKAKITTESGDLVKEIVLYDDGVHGDNHANDGVYCSIQPLDLEQGRYDVEFKAEGKTGAGESYVRLLQDHFYVLESSGGNKDYFLASILPLYVDLGEVEQGALEKASLRLSFEGREPRKVSMVAGDAIKMKNNSAVIPLEALGFPDELSLNPSQAEIFTLRCKIPKDQPIGQYSGTILIRMGDQELSLPFDVKVKEASFVREAPLVLDSELPSPRDIKPVLEEAKVHFSAPKMPGGFTPSAIGSMSGLEMSPLAKTDFIPKEPETEAIGANVIVVEKRPAIQFEVSPDKIDPFEMKEGTYANMIFTLHNLNDWAGNVMVELDGVGDMERPLIELSPDTSVQWAWSWQGREVKDAPHKIRLRFFNDQQSVERVLTWSLSPPTIPWFFYITIGLLAVIALVYGILYLVKGEHSDGFISASAMAHLCLAILAFRALLPPPEQKVFVDVKDMSFELLPEEVLKPDEVKEMMPVKDEQLVMRPIDKVELKNVRELKVDRPELTVTRQTAKPMNTDVQERSVPLLSSQSKIEDVERKLDSSAMADESVPTVLSLNDRLKRAKLRHRSPEEIQSEKLKLSRNEMALTREIRLNAIQMEHAPKEMPLESVKRDLQTPVLDSERKPFALAQPDLKKAPTALELKEDLPTIATQERKEQEIDVQDLKTDSQARVDVERDSRQLAVANDVAAGNVQLPAINSLKMTAMQGEIPKVETIKMSVPEKAITIKEEKLSGIQIVPKSIQESLESKSDIVMDYQENELIQGKGQVKISGKNAAKERNLILPKSAGEASIQKGDLTRSDTPVDALVNPVMSGNAGVEALLLPSEVVGSISLEQKSESISTPAQSVDFDQKSSSIGIAPVKVNATSKLLETQPVNVERSELLGPQNRAVKVPDQVDEKRNRSLPASVLRPDRISPIQLNREPLKK